MDTDSIVKKFIEAVPICKASTDSFNDFATKRILNLVSSLKSIYCCHHTKNAKNELTLTLNGGTLTPPVMLEPDGTSRPIKPLECRLRNITYASPLYVDVIVNRNGKKSVLKDVYFGRIPIMIYSYICHVKGSDRVKNGECPMDPGGYFIVNGMEKSLVGQKGPMYNRLIVYKRENSEACAVAVKSEKNHRVFTTTLKFKPNSIVTCTFPGLQDETPVMFILLTLGNTLDEIKSAFNAEELALLEPSFSNIPDNPRDHVLIREVYKATFTNEERLKHFLNNLFLPHMEMQYKSLYVINMIKELMAVSTGKILPTDRDSVSNQRVEMACTLMSTLFLHLMIKKSNDLRLLINKILNKNKQVTDKKLIKLINDNNSITDGFQYALSTGNWNTSFVNRTQRVGVAQALQRLSQLATISQLRRISSAINSEQKLTKPRYLHGSHWGRYCPAETPEGMNVGLETQLSVQAYVSLDTDPKVISEVISQYLLSKCMANVNKGVSVFINGIYEGNTLKADEVVKTVRKGRRSGQFSKDMSVSLKNQIHISTTAGRICRPLLICNNGLEYIKKDGKNMSWYEMLTSGVIEYLDCEEEDTCLVAFKWTDVKHHSHCEIDCTMINGVNAACIPYSDRNPAPRNTYQSAMGKQAQGVAQLNYGLRYDTTSNIMQYIQKPLVTTKLANLHNINPSGFNAIVCVCPFMGYGQEDSIIVNQYALDRGMARSDHYKTIKESLNSKEKTVFKKPEKKKKFAKYNKLDVDGLTVPGTEIKKRDAIIGKVKDDEDISVLSELNGRSDSVLMYQERDGSKGVKTRVRTTQIPTIGDKFSSRHGQKGTIGLTVRGEDLPFTMSGMTPDIIVNPHAFPSRMTVGHWLEMLTGKVSAISGNIADASPFNGVTVKDISSELKSYGFESMGNETLIDGITGEMHQVQMFMGCIFYQRLKHMVDYKIHARGRGRRNALTGQPNDGRSNGGGLRVGEMEKDSMNSHGVPYLLNERMLISSDAHEISVCPTCHNQFNIKHSKCTVCQSKAKTVQVPYAANLLMMELQSMCINTKIIV